MQIHKYVNTASNLLLLSVSTKKVDFKHKQQNIANEQINNIKNKSQCTQFSRFNKSFEKNVLSMAGMTKKSGEIGLTCELICVLKPTKNASRTKRNKTLIQSDNNSKVTIVKFFKFSRNFCSLSILLANIYLRIKTDTDKQSTNKR